jgi:hypothetical protein
MNNYKITFERSNGTVGHDTFTESSEFEARKSFRECYRHGTGKILDVENISFVSDIKEQLPSMVIWMAKTAVMTGVSSFHSYEKEKHGLYYEGVRVSAGILWKLFQSMSIECQKAIEIVAKDRDGYSGTAESYFDDFIIALSKVQNGSVKIRVEE